MGKIYLLLVLTFAGFHFCRAQSDLDTIGLPKVEISADRYRLLSPGSRVSIPDSITTAPVQDLSGLLTSASTVFIKSYGAGGSATISFRGTEPRHTAVLWNGFNINSSSLGMTDLSMVPIHAADRISLLHGGSGALYGNSAIGGTILLQAKEPEFKKTNKISVYAGAGSFSTHQAAIKHDISGKRITSGTRLFYNDSENNFRFINTAVRDKPIQTQQHAAFYNYGIVQELAFKINKNQLLSTGVWYQVYDREIPPLMTSAKSAAEQKDSLLRIYANYKINFDRAIITTKVAYFNEYQFYNDSLYYINASYNLKNYLGEIETRWVLSHRISVTSGVSFANTAAHIPEYKSTKKRTGYSIFTGVNVNPWPTWIFTLSARKEFQTTGTNKNPPLAPSFGIEGNLVKEKVILKVNSGRHYTLPTLNDLYWVPGGNPDLLPEDAWSADAGLLFISKDTRLPQVEITYFNSLTDNWIKWQPGAGGVYQPDNLKQVYSRGIEFSGSQNLTIKTIKVKADLLYTWCKSTNSGTYEIYGEPAIDKQLIYIPEHIARFNIAAVAGTFSVTLNHGFTSQIYTSSDNSTSLKEYFIADYTLQKTFLIQTHKIITYFQVMNVFDASYQVIAWRPMPGRWFMAGVKADINFIKK